MTFPSGLKEFLLLHGGAAGEDNAAPPYGAGMLGWLRSLHVAIATAAKQDEAKAVLDTIQTNTSTNHADLTAIKTSVEAGNTAQATAVKQDLIKTAIDQNTAKKGDVSTPDTELYLLKQLQSVNKPRTTLTSYQTGFVGTNTNLAYAWRTILASTLPAIANQIFVPTSFSFYGPASTVIGRLAERVCFGSWSATGNAYTDSFASPDTEFWTNVELELGNATGGGASPSTFDITYKNQDGVTKTATTAYNRADGKAGVVFPMTLAAGDMGVKDIVSVTNTSGLTAGDLKLYGVKEVATHSGDGKSLALAGSALKQGRELAFSFTSSGTGGVTVRASVAGYFTTEA